MFLAKSWKTVNGKRYPKWDLKKSVWDKKEKRNKQEYVAYIGLSKTISWEKACAICRNKGISLEELERVKRLTIEKPMDDTRSEVSIENPLQVKVSRQQRERGAEEMATENDLGFDVPEATPAEMVRDLRKYYGFGDTLGEYDDLAYRISPFIEAEELRMVEQDRAVLDGEAQDRLRRKWQTLSGKDT